MKLQNLSIIFLVIIIPLILILSYYLNLQQETLELQAEYDTKLAEATKEGVKAFEINTVDWSEWVNYKTTTTQRKEVKAAINTFISSLANNLNVSGTAKEYMVNYIPAVVATMYDGYYVYSPNYLPVTIENNNGVQLYLDKTTTPNRITTKSNNGANLPVYEPKDSATGVVNAEYTDENGVTTNLEVVTDIENAKKEYKHILNNHVAYVARYSKGSDTNVVVNYTLDNRIYVYGTVNNKNEARDGYLVWFDPTTTNLPRIYVTATNPKDDSSIQVPSGVNKSEYGNTSIETEILEEQVLYYEGGMHHLETFKYIYDINNDKLYYDESVDGGDFFTIDENKERAFINTDANKSLTVGSFGCRYKSVSVLWGNESKAKEYKKIYQVLNGADKGKWYIDIKTDSSEAQSESIEEVDTEIKEVKLAELGLNDLRFAAIYKDFSAINYYVEAYAFTNWVEANLKGVKQEIYNEDTGRYEATTIEVEGNAVDLFVITEANNPEKEDSPIVIHKKEIMKNHIITNLNLAISNYSMGTYEFRMPVLSDSDWNQVFSNISLITFFQGVPIGLKNYNNYAIATSTNNREYVDPGELYFSGDNNNYHRVYCEKCGNTVYTGYRSVEYVMREHKVASTGDMLYYYLHDEYSDSDDRSSETACYYCLVNKENFVATVDQKETYTQAKAYNEALARERYFQKEEIMAKVATDITISVTRKKTSITNTDIIFILDNSGSMASSGLVQPLKNAFFEILESMLKDAIDHEFYIGVVKFSTEADEVGSITRKSQVNGLKNLINTEITGSGNTYYSKGLNVAQEMINRDLNGSKNKRIIVFLSDGKNMYSDKSDASMAVSMLKSVYNVEGFFSIGFGGEVSEYLKEWPYSGFSIGDYYDASATDLSEKFNKILYSIYSSDPESIETVDGLLDISDMEVSTEKPMTVEVTRNGTTIKTITITEYPTSNEGVIIIKDGKMYLSVDRLAEKCGITDFEGINVSIEYFSKT